MTVRGLALAAALLASMPVEAAACHHYSRWYYPWPQRCAVVSRFIPEKLPKFGRAPRSPLRVGHEAPFVSLGRGPSGPAAIPLPSLARADLDGGEADEPARARLLLRAAMEVAQ
jgi:hypothetical protein